MVDAAEIEELQQAYAAAPEIDMTNTAALESIAEVIGYTIAYSRYAGWDEVDTIETLVRAAELSPDDVRLAEGVLRPLGYRDVCARLREITGRRKRSLAPLSAEVR